MSKGEEGKKRNFIHINEGFTCINCGWENPVAIGTCRNHCQNCLFSLHVDEEVPGDRASSCGGLMRPVVLDKTGKKGFVILHECLKCGRMMRNMVADDDNFEAVINLSRKDL